MTTKKTGRGISVIILVVATIIGGCNNGTVDDPPSDSEDRIPFVGEWWLNTETEKWRLNFYPEYEEQMSFRCDRQIFDGQFWDGAIAKIGTYTFSGNTADISIDGTTSRATIGADDKLTWQGTVYTRTVRMSGTLTISPSNPAKGQTLTANYSGSEPVTYAWHRGATELGTSKTQVADQAGEYMVQVDAQTPGYFPQVVSVIVKPPKPTPLAGNASYSQTVATLDAIIEYCTLSPTIVNNSIKTSANGTKDQIMSNPAAWDTMGPIQIPIINDQYIFLLE